MRLPRLRNGLCFSVPSTRCLSSTALNASELARRPFLDRTGADPDTLQDLDALPVPILREQFYSAFRSEFKKPILTRTDWSLFDKWSWDMINGDWWRASRLIHSALASWRNRENCTIPPSQNEDIKAIAPARGFKDPEAFVSTVVEWIRKECELMQLEIESGNTARYEDPQELVTASLWNTLNDAQRTALQPALDSMAKASKLHPEVKREIIGHIASVVRASIK